MNNTKEAFFDIFGMLSMIKNEFYQFLPNLFVAIMILLLGVLFAFVIKWFSQRIVNWIFLIIPRNISNKSLIKENLNSISVGLGRILFILIVVLALSTSMNKLGLTILSSWLGSMAKFAPNIVGAIFILFLGWISKGLVLDITRRAIDKIGGHHSKLISELASWSIFILTIFIALDQIGIDLGIVYIFIVVFTAIPFLGITLTFALGAKSSIENILACYHLRRLLAPNDVVNINGEVLNVVSIGPVLVIMRTDEREMAITGSMLLKSNFSKIKGN